MKETDNPIMMVSLCGDEIEVWEVLSQLIAYCEDCKSYHKYLPEY